MIAYLSFEWLKLTKRWMPKVILAMVLGLLILIYWGQGARSESNGYLNLFLPRGWLAALAYCSFFAPFFWPVLGGSWAGNEYGWGTIRMVLTRRPYRIQQALAALAILLIALALALVAILIVGGIAGVAVALLRGDSAFTSGVLDGTFLATFLKGFLAAWYVSAFYLVLAYTAAVVFRSAAVGIGIGIGANLAQIILTGIFFSLGGVWKTVAQHFPFLYSRDLITQVVHGAMVPGTNLASVDPSDPSAGASLLALAIYAAAFLAITLVAVRTRDVTA